MIRRFGAILCAYSTIIFCGSVVLGQEFDEDTIKEEVLTAWNAYIAAFSAGQTDVVANRIYSTPSFQVGAQGVTTRLTARDTKVAFDEIHQYLATERYSHSETDTATICVLNSSSALLTAHFTRYRDDNSVLANGASAYFFGKFDDDWRIMAIIGNPTAKLIDCD
tara:strand:+ start:574 stop:1068 length:495 start_codon:yes stop_codon:yes gene_type:complete